MNKPLQRRTGNNYEQVQQVEDQKWKLNVEVHDKNEEHKEIRNEGILDFLSRKKNKYAFLSNEKSIEVDINKVAQDKGLNIKNIRLATQERLLKELESEQHQADYDFRSIIMD